MATTANNAVLIRQLIRKAAKSGWKVICKGSCYPAKKCIACGSPTSLFFERKGVKKSVCFRCSAPKSKK